MRMRTAASGGRTSLVSITRSEVGERWCCVVGGEAFGNVASAPPGELFGGEVSGAAERRDRPPEALDRSHCVYAGRLPEVDDGVRPARLMVIRCERSMRQIAPYRAFS